MIARWKSAGLVARDALPDEGPLDFLVHGPVMFGHLAESEGDTG